jgi:opacity protein-like surface antigen
MLVPTHLARGFDAVSASMSTMTAVQCVNSFRMVTSPIDKAMKHLLVGSAILLIAGTPVRAADIAPRADIQAAPVRSSVPPSWDWSGLYLGGHIGAALSTTDFIDPFGTALFGDQVRSPGFIGGSQIGYNYQSGQMVLGVEADVSWDNSDGTNTCFAVSGRIVSSNCRARPDLYATLTGRLGVAAGHTLFYGKAGAAWTRGAVDINFNQNNFGPAFTTAVFNSSNSFDAAGWTAGGGIEYALTAAWSAKLEYDYLRFGGRNVTTPYVVGNPSGLTAPVTGASEDVHQVKFGMNYRFGVDERPWRSDATTIPIKAPGVVQLSGWEAEAGARYMYSLGRFQKDQNTGFANGSSVPNGIVTSRLSYSDLRTNSSELFGRVESPWNVFVKGYIGAGQTASGKNSDEDSYVALNGTRAPYSNSYSPKIDGGIAYAVGDLGYDFIRANGSKLGAFVGYFYFNQLMNRYNCVQIANPQGSCEAPDQPPTPSNFVRFQEIDSWRALRVGLSGETMLTDRLKLGFEGAYLPYLVFDGLDNHFRDPVVQFPASSHGGQGAQVEALLSYYLTDQFALGIGGRYWTMWTANGQFVNTSAPGLPRYYRAAFEQAGAFVQASYTFGASGARTTATYLELPKTSATAARTEWNGFYVGMEGGGDWGRSKHVNNANDITTNFATAGGVVGGTAGYNAQFGGGWLVGFEGDLSWTNADGSASNLAPRFDPASSSETRERWLSTARMRLGTMFANRWLAYVTGGVALADVEAIARQAAGDSFSQSHVRAGWTAGAGVEYAIDKNWSAKLEYLHVGLNDASYLNYLDPAVNGVNRGGGVPLGQEIVRAGVNYRVE